MVRCAVCGREAAPDEIEECRYCSAVCCAGTCLDEHERQAHPDDAIPLDDDGRE